MKRAAALVAVATVVAGVAACSGSPRTTQVPEQVLAVNTTAAVAPSTPIDRARAYEHVKLLSSKELLGRGTGADGDFKAAKYVEDRFRQLGLTTTRQAFPYSSFSRKTADNVFALLPGSEPGDRFVAVGAHRDHLGARGGTWYPGADDNASGTAAVLEIAANLVAARARGEGPKTAVLFMSWSGEEIGLIGSRYYTRNPVVPDGNGGARKIGTDKIRGYVNMDVIAIGRLHQIGVDAEGPQFPFPPGVNPFDKLVQNLAARRGAQVHFEHFVHDDEAPLPPGIIREPIPMGASSDHAPFRQVGVPAPCFYSYPAFRRYLHTPEDTLPEFDVVQKKPEDRFDIDILVEVGGVAQDTLMAMANN